MLLLHDDHLVLQSLNRELPLSLYHIADELPHSVDRGTFFHILESNVFLYVSESILDL